MVSETFLADLASSAKTKDDFKKALISRLDSMAVSGDRVSFEGVLRQIARVNTEYETHNGDSRDIKYAQHPMYNTTKTICIYVNGEPVSVGWNKAVSEEWAAKKDARKKCKPAPAASAPKRERASENMPRGGGQLFKVDGHISDPKLLPSDLSSLPCLKKVYENARSATKRFEDELRRGDDSIIGVTAAFGSQTISCLYVFQKRWHHAGFDNYIGSFHRNCLVSGKMENACELFVLDVAFVAAIHAANAEQSVYETLVREFGANVLPQMPVNGVKIVEITCDQEQTFSSFEREDHPCKKLLTAECGSSIFSKDDSAHSSRVHVKKKKDAQSFTH